MSEPIEDFRPDSDATQLADALRRAAEARAPLAEARRGEDEARLNELGDLEHLTTAAKPGPAAPFMRAARRLLHVLVRPWLSMQTIYNRELARRFEQTTTRTHDLDRRLPEIEQAVHVLESRLAGLEQRGSPAAMMREHPDVRLDSLFTLFAHSRLPAPPARVLVCGNAAPMAAALDTFGFDVVAVGTPVPSGASVRTVSGVASLADGSCDAAIWHRIDVAAAGPAGPREIARVLAPGACMFTSVRMTSHDPAPVVAHVSPLAVVSVLLLQQAEGAWSAVPVPASGVETIAFVEARRPDVPDR
jgi:hypothetical protein